MTDAILIYITCASETEAREISRALLETKLIACANILPGMKSSYWWENKIEESNEAVLILKSEKKYFTAIEEKVRELHSYSCPCLLALPVQSGSKDYLSWISKQF